MKVFFRRRDLSEDLNVFFHKKSQSITDSSSFIGKVSFFIYKQYLYVFSLTYRNLEEPIVLLDFVSFDGSKLSCLLPVFFRSCKSILWIPCLFVRGPFRRTFTKSTNDSTSEQIVSQQLY